jgi:TolB-like protein/DNA-binding winged helix-turn-helix (wHTH) protein
MAVSASESLLRFGVFEVDLKAAQLRKNGIRIRLQQQPFQLLCLLLDRPGEVVTREELRQRLWSPDVFVDFEHGLNKSVQKLRDALGDSADAPLYIETIPRVGYRFIAPVSVAGGQAAVEDSRVPLNGNSTAPISAEVRGAAPVTSVPQRGRRLLSIASAGLVIALTLVSVWLILKQPHRVAAIHSLAVLPLDNLSGDPGQEYFADGMTDELTTMLAKDSTLRIVSRTSAMQYKGVHRPLREIAQALGVDDVLEGSVERNGDKVHMTLQLIEGPSDTHVWAESYDRDANDLVSLPEEAAVAIAKLTNSAVLKRTPARYVSPEAHEAYFRGEHIWYSGNPEEAIKHFQKAVDLQPDYALAWRAISEYYGSAALGGDQDPREALGRMEAAAQKAVELDDSLPDAHVALCGAIFLSEWDWARADRECVRAIEMDPRSSDAYHMRARLFAAVNRHDEGIAQEKIATDLVPFSMQWGLARSYLWARKYDLGIADARLRLETSPGNAETLENLSNLYRCKGMYAEAAQTLAEMFSAQGDKASSASVRQAFQEGGYHAVLQWNLDSLQQQSQKHYVSPVFFALQYAQLGQREEAISYLQEAYRQRSPMLLWIQDDPAYDFLHSDERYRSLINRIGVPAEY